MGQEDGRQVLHRKGTKETNKTSKEQRDRYETTWSWGCGGEKHTEEVPHYGTEESVERVGTHPQGGPRPK